jgi:hypothetical protein
MEGLADYGENAVMEQGPQARYSQDRKMFVRFYTKPVRNNFKSSQENRPVYDDVEYVEIRIPGDRNSIFNQPVKQEHRIRFADRYERFKKNAADIQSGTPLSEWTQMTPGLVEELKYFGIQTVDQLAEMDDIHGQKIPNFHTFKAQAQAFLEKAKEGEQDSKLAAALEQRDNEIAALKEQVNTLIKAGADAKTTTTGRGKGTVNKK